LLASAEPTKAPVPRQSFTAILASFAVLASWRDPHPFPLPRAGEGEGEGISHKVAKHVLSEVEGDAKGENDRAQRETV